MSDVARFHDGFCTAALLLGERAASLPSLLPAAMPLPSWVHDVEAAPSRQARASLLARASLRLARAVAEARPAWG